MVFGLGLIGLLTVQILRANGCNVYGIDLDREKCEIAEKFGAKCFSSSEDCLSSILTTNPKGIDGVIISASAKTNEIIEKSAELCRKRGRIILVGVVGLNLDRSLFYEKELSFQVSCSYGPGRYNKNYEEKGLDYPIEFVRWTENRNFYAVLDLMSQEKILTKMLITANFSFDSASDAYDSLKSSKALGLILDYDFAPLERTLKYQNNKNSESINKPKVSFIGAGNYASRVLMPAFSKAGFDFVTLQTKSGISANKFGKKFNFKQITTDEKVLLSDNSDLVVIATRHDLHCDQVCKVLENKKNVFVEKPLALNSDQLNKIKDVYKNCNQQLIVGFNRRFSPHIEILKNEINKSDSLKSILLTMNAGTIEDDHWTQDKEVGGGRIIGEACHYIDLLIHLLGDEIDNIEVSSLGDSTNTALDTAVINIKFKSGSIGAINYISNGSKSFPKERIEVFFDEKVIQVDNFKSTRAFGLKGFKNKNTFSLQKGQNEMAKLLYSCLENGKDFPIQINEIFTSAELSIKADSML